MASAASQGCWKGLASRLRVELTTTQLVVAIFWSANMRENPGDIVFDDNGQKEMRNASVFRIGLWGWQ